MTIQIFKKMDVVTVVTNHYNNDRHEFYQEYDFARIIDITDNSYVLDLQVEAIVDNRINITVDVNTLQLSKEIHRWFSEYLDDQNLHDYICDLEYYIKEFKKQVVERQENSITNTLESIFYGYTRKDIPQTILDISNTKDEIFLSFEKLRPQYKKLIILRDMQYHLNSIDYYIKKDYSPDNIQRYYQYALEYCKKLDKKDCYENFKFCV